MTPIERIRNVIHIIKENKPEGPTQILVSPEFYKELKKECLRCYQPIGSIGTILGLKLTARRMTEEFVIL